MAALLLTMASVSAAAQQPLLDMTYTVTKMTAKRVTLVDLNDDGRCELITERAIYRSNSIGEFTGYLPVSTGADCFTLPIDLNGDGRLDLAVAENTALRILLATSSGGYSHVATHSISSSSTLAGGDFDEDGFGDLVVVNSSQTNVRFGTGDGAFRETREVPFGTGQVATTGDFNRDGHLDIAVAEGRLGFEYGDGNGNFQSRNEASLGGASAIRTCDLNGDGWWDLVIQSQYAPAVLVNRGDGTFNSAGSQRTGYVSCADFNGDGPDDLVVGGQVYSGSDRDISIFVGNSERRVHSPGLVRGLDTGDINGDGKADLVVCTEGWVFASLGNGDGTVGPLPDARGTGIELHTVAYADFDGNGFLDLAGTYYGEVRVGLGYASGFSGPIWNTRFGVTENPGRVRGGDLDGDGRADLVVSVSTECGYHCYRYSLWIWRSIPGGFERNGGVEMSGPFEIADATGDGIADIIGFQLDPVSQYSLPTVISGIAGGGLGSPIRSTITLTATMLKLGDVNGDSIPDLASDYGICRGLGGGQFGPVTAYPGGIHYDAFVLADVDKDGRDELIGSRYPAIDILDGLEGNPTIKVLSGAVPGPVAVGDVNDDGFPDIASGAPITSLFLGYPDGMPRFDRYYGGELQVVENLPIALTDVDGDGLDDLLTQSMWGRNTWRLGDRIPPQVRIESPNDGGSFVIGAPITLRWTSSDSSGVDGVDVDIVLGLNPGTAVLARVGTRLPATGSVEWTPEPRHKGRAYVRAIARDIHGNEAHDESDDPFDIVSPAPVVPVTLDSISAVLLPRGVRVSWRFSPSSEISSVTLFRCSGTSCNLFTKVAENLQAEDRYDDRGVVPGSSYTYAVEATTVSSGRPSGSVTVALPDTAADPPPPLPNPARSLALSAGPSPFASSTTVQFSLPGTSPVRLSVFDVRGREIGVLVDEVRGPGTHSMVCLASVANRIPGVYFIRLTTQFGARSQRVVLLP